MIANNLFVSSHNSGAYEISEIQFIGNEKFLSSELLEYITSKPTKTSLPNKIISTYYYESQKNPNMPQTIIKELNLLVKNFENEYSYFNQEVANLDLEILGNLYKTNGFHRVTVRYSFLPDTVKNRNILTFYIQENEQYKLQTKINYVGLENLPHEVKARIDTTVKLKNGDFFNEEKIETEIQNVQNILLRTGYMHSKWEYPYVMWDSVNFTDSVVTYFDAGDRIKIGKIIFVDSTFGQQIVADSYKNKLVRFKSGDYYNRNRIERSIDNLLSIGTFESVRIDTVEKNYANDDFSRDFLITSKYKNLREWDGGLFFNQTQIDNFINIGIEGAFLHRNLFGAAQSTKLFVNFSLKDLNRAFSKLLFPDFEFKIGGTYYQPLIWQLENSNIALSTSIQYSLQILSGLFKISKVSFPIYFPIRLARRSYFNNLSIEFDMDREVPLNYDEVVGFALDSAHSRQDTNNILSAVTLYGNIYRYLNDADNHFLTSNLLKVSIIGDDLNHRFSPTQGSLTYLSLDGFNIFFSHPYISGGAKYFRFQALHNRFFQLSRVLVLGFKGKIGLTYLFDESNSFVPQDRQFFAGGANSVRAWNARSLRYSPHTVATERETTINDFANDYIGSKTLIEASIEFRRKLSDIPGLSDNIAWFFNDLGLGLFLDVGNTFGWYIETAETKTKLKYSDYITKLAIATGFGLRYETSIGPIRFDFATPVYDPMQIRRPFGDLVFVFAIGHAF